MCNLYSITKSQRAIRDLVKAIRDLTGNLQPLPAVFPNRMAPVVRTRPGFRGHNTELKQDTASVFARLFALARGVRRSHRSAGADFLQGAAAAPAQAGAGLAGADFYALP